MPKSMKYGSPARLKMVAGVRKLGEAVVSTLGPKGRNVVIDRGFGAPNVTKDGVTVAKAVELEDREEQMGVELVREAASRTNDRVGDGTTTATALAVAIIEGAERAVFGSRVPVDVHAVRAGLEKAKTSVLASLDKQKKEVKGDMLEQVATISANNNQTLGKLVAGLVRKVGRDGVVTVEESKGLSIETEFVEGMEINRGYMSGYMITNPERGEAVHSDAPVLVTDSRINSIQDLLPLIQGLAQSGTKQLVIVAEDVSHDVLSNIVYNKINGHFFCTVVKAPGYGENRKESLRDLALVLGAQLISSEAGHSLKDASMADLGRAKRVVAKKDTTVFAGGQGNNALVEDRMNGLKEQIKNADSEFDKEKLRERLAKLAGGVAVIKVGAPTEAEMKELRYLIEDAVYACKAAVEDGVVAGGGSALLAARMSINSENDSKYIGDEIVGCELLLAALEAPLVHIALNAGERTSLLTEVYGDLEKHPRAGFDAKNGVLVKDMVAEGIMDPVRATKQAVENAVSAASAFITSSCLMTEIPKEEKAERVNL